LSLLPALHNVNAIDVAIRARREAYAANMDALQSDIDSIRDRVTPGEASA